MPPSPALAELLTPDSLSAILGRAVARVEVDVTERHFSSVARVIVDDELQLFAKTAPRQSEVAFHRDVQSRIDAPAIRCHYAAMHGDEGVLLLADVSATHREPDHRLPTETYAAVVDVLAAFHSRGFDTATAAERANRGFEFVIARATEALPAFLDAVDLGRHDRHRLRAAVARWPEHHRARIDAGRGLTVLHGDLHPGNVMLPNDGADPMLFVDWSDWRVEPGPVDLSFLLLTMDSGQRREAERDLVSRWHSGLAAPDYGFDGAWLDYRIAIAGSVIHPLFWWISGSPEVIWRMGLSARLAAVADLDALNAV